VRLATFPPFRLQSVIYSGISHISDLEDLWPSIWLVNRAVAEAYGLTPDDFEYILSTFPVFARKRPAFYTYLQEQVRLWKEEVTLQKMRVFSRDAGGTGRSGGGPACQALPSPTIGEGAGDG
jgi:hypothetical protein